MIGKFLEILAMLILVVVYFAIMFVPSYIAYARRHEHRIVILAINFFLGWTGLGWAAIMVWALTEETLDNAPAAAGARAAMR